MNKLPIHKQVLLVLLISGFFGFCLGMFGYPVHQEAIEPAQLISGVVKYPQGNPFQIIYLKAWTIVHQLCALLLKIGFTERMLSFFLSGVIGMLSYQALALSVLSISLSPLLSILSPFFIHATKLYLGGITYGIMLMGEPRTCGMISPAYMLLTAALLSLRQYKLGALLLGIAPAVHPAVGLWFTMIFMLTFMWDLEIFMDFLKEAKKYIIIGYAITLASFILYWYFLHKSNLSLDMDHNILSKYISAFIGYWDAHRHPFRLSLLKPIMLTVFMSFLWSISWKKDLPRNSAFLLKSCIVSAVVATVFSTVYWLPLNKVPIILLSMMPSRVFNFIFLAFVPILIGLFWVYRNNFMIQVAFAAFIIAVYRGENLFAVLVILGLFLSVMLSTRVYKVGSKNLLRVNIASDFRRNTLVIITSIVVPLGIVLILRLKPIVFASYFFAIVLILMVWLQKNNPTSLFQNQNILGPLKKMTLAMLFVSVFAVGKSAIRESKNLKFSLYDHADDKVFATLRDGQGMVLSGSNIEFVSLRSRRTVLLNNPANLDLLSYVPEAGPATNLILQRVYGVDIFYPPPETRREGGLHEETGRKLWESRTLQDWISIGKEFGVTDVVTYSDWKLKLPQIVRGGLFIVYGIPGNDDKK